MAFGSIPTVTRKELKEHLSKYFNLGDLVSYKKIKRGLANSVYYLKTTKGDFALRIAVRHNSGKIYYEIKLLNALRGLSTPKLIKTKNGKSLFDYKGHKSFIYPFLPGQEEKKFTKHMLFEVGEFLGKLHRQTEGFTSKVERERFYDISSKKLNRIIKENKNAKNLKIKEALIYLKEKALNYKLLAGLPTGAMHIDAKPENILFKNGRLSGVVDFDNSYTGPLVFDLADTLMWFCSNKGTFDIEKAKEIYRGYVSARKLLRSEQASLFNALHNVFLASTLCCIDYLCHEKLPKAYVIWIIDNLLETEKKFKLTKNEFENILFN